MSGFEGPFQCIHGLSAEKFARSFVDKHFKVLEIAFLDQGKNQCNGLSIHVNGHGESMVGLVSRGIDHAIVLKLNRVHDHGCFADFHQPFLLEHGLFNDAISLFFFSFAFLEKVQDTLFTLCVENIFNDPCMEQRFIHIVQLLFGK